MRASTLVLVLAVAIAGCSGDPQPEAVDVERDFLEAIEGEGSGMLSETPALDKRVMRETPMRLLIDPEDSPLIEFPTLGGRGNLMPMPDASPPSTATTLRLFQNVTPVKAGSVCQPGPVRIIRSGGTATLEFAYLGDTLRKIQATLRRTP